MTDVAMMIRESAGSDSPVQLVPYSEAYPEGGFEDMQRRVPDCDKLQRITGFRPEISLERIIADVVADRRLHLASI